MSSLFCEDRSHISPIQREGTKLVDYSPELFDDIMDSFEDSWLIGYTVCGAQDPMVIQLGERFRDEHPEFAKYSTVRIIDRFLNSWNSATDMEFSNTELTDAEYEMAMKIQDEEDSGE